MNGSMANVSDSFADFAAIETQTGFSSQFGAFADFDSINQFESKTEIFKNLFDSNTNFDFEFKIDDDEKIFSDFGPSTFDDFSETTITDPIILTEPQANKATLVGNNSELSSHPSEVRVNDAGSSGTHSEMTASWVSNGQSNSLESEISTPKPLSSSVQDSSLQKSLEPSSSSNGRNSPTSSPTTSLSSSGSITSPESESASESSVPEGITANVSPESTLKPPLTANGNSPIFLSSTNSSGAKISAAFEDLEF